MDCDNLKSIAAIAHGERIVVQNPIVYVYAAELRCGVSDIDFRNTRVDDHALAHHATVRSGHGAAVVAETGKIKR